MSEDMISEHAVVSPSASIGKNVRIGAYTVIDDNVEIGDGTEIGTHCHIRDNSDIGDNCRIDDNVKISTLPVGFKPETETGVTIHDKVVIGPDVIIEHASKEGYNTVIGENSLVMAQAIIGHNSRIGKGVTIAPGVKLAGYVNIEDLANIGGGVGVHQFVSIGKLAFIGGGINVTKDVVPYAWFAENKNPKRNNMPRVYGLNAVGINRANMTQEEIKEIKEVFSALKLEETLDDKIIWLTAMRTDSAKTVKSFLEKSTRGIYRVEGNRLINPTKLYKNSSQYHASRGLR